MCAGVVVWPVQCKSSLIPLIQIFAAKRTCTAVFSGLVKTQEMRRNERHRTDETVIHNHDTGRIRSAEHDGREMTLGIEGKTCNKCIHRGERGWDKVL